MSLKKCYIGKYFQKFRQNFVKIREKHWKILEKFREKPKKNPKNLKPKNPLQKFGQNFVKITEKHWKILEKLEKKIPKI